MSYDRDYKKRQMRRRIIPGRQSEEEYAEDLERTWNRRRKIRRGIILGIVIAMVLAAIAAFLIQRYYQYSTCELVKERELSEGSFVGYERYGEYALKYSHDGASCIDKNGEDVWVDSYEMKNPVCYVSGEYACIADIKGNNIFIYNTSGRIGNADTTLPITKAVISENGIVATVEEEEEAAFIHFYNKTGETIDISIKSLLSGDGYPVDIALSPAGTQLITAYACLENGQIRSKVIFYDFSEIGKNVPNRLVGGFEAPFTESLVGRVRFLNDTYSYAVADTGIYFFSSKNISSPELIQEIPITESTIESIYHNDEQVGLVLHNPAGSETQFSIVEYSGDGSEKLRYDFDAVFNHVSSDGKYLYIVGDSQCTIVNAYGNVKYQGEMKDSPQIITHGNWPGRFVAYGGTYVREYALK